MNTQPKTDTKILYESSSNINTCHIAENKYGDQLILTVSDNGIFAWANIDGVYGEQKRITDHKIVDYVNITSNSNGDFVIVWRYNNQDIYYSTQTNKESWNNAKKISTGHDINILSNESVIILTYKDDNGIYFVESKDGLFWSTPKPIITKKDTSSSKFVFYPSFISFSKDENGDFFVSYENSHNLEVARYLKDKGFSSPRTINVEKSHIEKPSIVHANQYSFLVWHCDKHLSVSYLNKKISLKSQEWSIPQNIPAEISSIQYLSTISVDDDKKILVIFEDRTGDIFSITYDIENGWEKLIKIGKGLSHNLFKNNNDQIALLLWNKVRFYKKDFSWSEEHFLTEDSSYLPSVHYNKSDDFIFIWCKTKNKTIFVQKYLRNGNWGEKIEIYSSSSKNIYRPVTKIINDNIHIVWIEKNKNKNICFHKIIPVSQI